MTSSPVPNYPIDLALHRKRNAQWRVYALIMLRDGGPAEIQPGKGDAGECVSLIGSAALKYFHALERELLVERATVGMGEGEAHKPVPAFIFTEKGATVAAALPPLEEISFDE